MGIFGGAPKAQKRKKGENPNPFVEEQVEYATVADAQNWQDSFNHGIAIGAMNDDQVDVRAMLMACDANGLD
jgi:hypothetical protein